jgi:hypothetical protein
MVLDPDHGFGLLSPEDQEKIELILTERSEGSYGAPALHGMLTASVVGPKPVRGPGASSLMLLHGGKRRSCKTRSRASTEQAAG